MPASRFAAGHNFGVLGANGAGKSTLIRLLAGSEMPDRGTIRRYARVSFPLGFGGTFHGALSGRENVAFLARVYGAAVRPTVALCRGFRRAGRIFRDAGQHLFRRHAGAARFWRLPRDRFRRLPDRRGDRDRRRAFRRKCADAFRERMRRSDIILVTHNRQTIRQYCDRAAVLADGRLRFHDNVRTAFDDYRTRVMEAA